MKSIKYIIPIIFASVVFLVACSDKSEKKKVEDSTNTKTQTVEVVKAEKRIFTAEIQISGTAMPNKKVILYAMESGYVQKIRKDIGEPVTKGELIAVLKNPELERELEIQSAKLKAKKAIYERLKSVYSKTPAITTAQAVENAESNYLTANAKYKSIQDRINLLKITAPFGGVITKRMVDQGALMQSGLTEDNPQGIVEIQEINPIRLTIPLPESDIASVNKGQVVNIEFPELPGSSFQAIVSRTAGALDPASKTMRIEVDVDNIDKKIKPGMYAKVNMEVASRKDVISLPVTAQVLFQNQPCILVVQDNVVVRIPLKKGLSNKDFFEVLNTEIDEKSLVIVQGKGLVKLGDIVKPVIKSN